jgi:hypothetical protein
MPKSTKAEKSETAKEMRSKGARVGAIARHLNLPMEGARRLVFGDGYRNRLEEFPSRKPISSPQALRQSPTPEVFVKWLQNEATPLLGRLPEWPMGVEKYTYFDSEAVWDTATVLATIEEPSELARAHRNGDPEAIFRFAKSNRKALLAKWVQRQLVEWRISNTPQSGRQFKKFMSAYWNQQGHRNIRTMVEKIELDQAIYSDSLTWPKGSRVSGLSRKFNVSEDRVKDVLKHYKSAYLRWMKSKRAHLWLSTTAPSSP